MTEFHFQVVKRYHCSPKSTTEPDTAIYNYKQTHFYSKVTFFWLNLFMCKGYYVPEATNDIGEIPDDERSKVHFNKFKKYYKQQKVCILIIFNTRTYTSFFPLIKMYLYPRCHQIKQRVLIFGNVTLAWFGRIFISLVF